MYREIVVGVDEREQSRDAVALARLIARRTGARLVAAHVYSLPGPYPFPGDVAWNAQMRELATSTADKAIEPGLTREQSRAVASTSPARGLHDLAESEKADLIVVGSAHRGKLGRIFAGTTGHALLNGAPCPVAVAPVGFAQRADAGLETIGVAYDGQPESEIALTGAIDFAQSVGARLSLVTLAYPPESWFLADGHSWVNIDEVLAQMTQAMEAVQEDALERIPESLRAPSQVFGDPSVSLVDVKEIDLLVMGSRNYGPLRRTMVGSLARQVMTRAPWPVIVLPRGATVAGRGPAEKAEAAGSSR